MRGDSSQWVCHVVLGVGIVALVAVVVLVGHGAAYLASMFW